MPVVEWRSLWSEFWPSNKIGKNWFVIFILVLTIEQNLNFCLTRSVLIHHRFHPTTRSAPHLVNWFALLLLLKKNRTSPCAQILIRAKRLCMIATTSQGASRMGGLLHWDPSTGFSSWWSSFGRLHETHSKQPIWENVSYRYQEIVSISSLYQNALFSGSSPFWDTSILSSLAMKKIVSKHWLHPS